MVLCFFCRSFFAPPGEKRTTESMEWIACINPILDTSLRIKYQASRISSRFPIHWNSGAADDPRVGAGQEQDHAGDILGLDPAAAFGGRVILAIFGRVDCTG